MVKYFITEREAYHSFIFGISGTKNFTLAACQLLNKMYPKYSFEPRPAGYDLDGITPLYEIEKYYRD